MKTERFSESRNRLKASWRQEILDDEGAVASLREAEEDVKAGRVMDYRRLV